MNLKIRYKLKSHPPDKLLTYHLQRVANASHKMVQELLTVNKIATSIPHKDLMRAAFIIGATHDIGKGTSFFQSYLLDSNAQVDPFLKSHAMISSLYCSWLILNDKEISENNRKFLALASSLVIQGHHGSLKSRTKYVENLNYFREHEIFRKQIESYKISQEEMEAITAEDLRLKSFKKFCDDWEEHWFYFCRNIVLLEKLNFADKMEPYFIINLMFSALLDADNFDAAELERPQRLEIDQDIIRSYIENNFEETSELDKLRNILFEHVDKQPISLDNKIYTLTAPTGLGKTLTSMNFALRLRKHIEKEKGYRPRIIYVAPFISILDQNMEVIQKVLLHEGQENTNLLLMHHHLANVNYHDNIKDEGYTTLQSEFLTHGWNAEVIVATFIQFFIMVFGRFTSQLRRLDNTVGSIVILDEIQSVPFELWDIIRNALLFLSNKLNFTIVLMTATQPLIFEEGEIVEIAATNKEIQELPPRVSFQLRNQEPITLDNFCSEMNDLISKNRYKNILIELNTIYTARECFDRIRSDSHDIRYLSSQVIQKHRRHRIHEIKESLLANRPTVLITTQVIEAGVDLDFDIAIRDIGPIDSIVQTAGRCNREGQRKSEDSLFYVYRIKDDRHKNARDHARYVYGDVAIEISQGLLNGDNLDVVALVNSYYIETKRRKSKQQSNQLYSYIADLDYEKVEKECRILDEDLYKLPVFVEFDKDATIIWEKYLTLNNVDDSKERKTRRTAESIQLRNQMGQYMIDVRENEVYAANLHDVGGIYKINRNQIGILYDEEVGFVSLH